MKLTDCNNSSSLVVDNIEKIGKRGNFSIAVFLFDERTDTNIRFETESFVEIGEWQQKSEVLLSDHKLELENFSFHADHKIINVDGQRFENIQNFFTLSSGTGNGCLNFTIESRVSFEEMFVDEITRVIQLGTSYDDIIPGCSQEENLIRIALSKKKKIIRISCVACSWIFHRIVSI